MDQSAEASTINKEDSGPQWPPRPRMFSVRGCSIVLIGLAFSFAMALAIVRTRSMPTGYTAPFWGVKASDAIRMDRPVELLRPLGSTAATELEFYNDGWIDFTEFRDLGYFRRVFLDDNNFDWKQAREMELPAARPDQWPWAFVRFGQSSPDSESTTIAIHLNEGWVGVAGHSQATRFTASVRRRIAHRLRLIARVPPGASELPK